MDIKQHLQTLLTRIENTKQAWAPYRPADDAASPEPASFAHGFLTCLDELEGELNQLFAVIRNEEKLARLQQTVNQKRQELENRPDTLKALEKLPSPTKHRLNGSDIAERHSLGS